MKAIKILANQMILYFIIIISAVTVYTFGLLDSIQINWEPILTALSLFGVGWNLFCIAIILFSIFIIKKWNDLERDAKSFSNII
jgi:hypothetical protein